MKQIKTDYPNVPNFVVEWMLDIHDRNPEYFKNEWKKQKGKVRKSSVKTTLNNLNVMASGESKKTYELQSVSFKHADATEDPESPIQVVFE